MRTIIWAGLVTLTVAGCAAAPAATAGSGVGASTATAPEPTLVGTDWQLISYREPGAGAPVPVTVDSTISFTAKGIVSVHACNYIGATARVGPATMTINPGATTDIGCSGENGEVERQVNAMLAAGTVRWSIRDRVLTLTDEDRQVLAYRVRPSPYPDLGARTIAAGDLAGGNWRLAAGPTDRGPFLIFEERAEPGAAWGSAGIASPERADCLASYVIEAGVLGGQHYVAAWATPEVGKVTVRATPASAVQTLPFHAVPVRACGSPAPGWPTSAPVPARSPSTTGPLRSSRRTRRGRAGSSAEPSGADAVVRTDDPCRGAGPGTRPRKRVGWASSPGSYVVAHRGSHRRCPLGGERGSSTRIRGRR